MDLVVLNRQEVRDLLQPADCLKILERAMQTALRDDALQPPRWVIDLPDGAAFSLMPGYLPEPACVGAKVITVFPGNFGTEYQSHQGAVMLFDLDHGTPLGIFHGGEITAIRTAAASALATRCLAREDAGTLALLGYGEQADTHLDAICSVRNIHSVVVWGRSAERARAFTNKHSPRFSKIDFRIEKTARDAVTGVDIICTLTSAFDPILKGEWLEEGVHLNVVGSSVAAYAEVDEEAVARATMFVDYKPSTVVQGGEYLRALDAGKIGDDHIAAQIGEVLGGHHPGRTKPTEITMYKSLGINAQDLASAYFLYHRAREHKTGTWIDF
jgi:ornithine cyclodeaminase